MTAYPVRKSVLSALILAIGLLPFQLLSQNASRANLDSLNAVWQNESNPAKDRMAALDFISWDIYLHTQKDSSIKYAKRLLNLAEQFKDSTYLSVANSTLGSAFYFEGAYHTAIDYHSKALKIRELMNDQTGQAGTLSNLGNILHFLGEQAEARQYFDRAQKIFLAHNDSGGLANNYNNIGNIMANTGKPDSAIYYYELSLELHQILGNVFYVAQCQSNMANNYDQLGDREKAIDLHLKTLALREQMKDEYGRVYSLGNLANLYFKSGNIDQALKIGSEAVDLTIKYGLYREQATVSKVLYKIHKQSRSAGKALYYHELYLAAKDSVHNDENRSASIRQHYQYEAEADSILAMEEKKLHESELAKEQAESAQHKAESAQHKAELENKRSQQYALFGGLAIVIIFAIFMFKPFQGDQETKGHH